MRRPSSAVSAVRAAVTAATVVINSLTYRLGYGPLGSLVNVLMFRGVVERAAAGFLQSLANAAAAPN